MSNKLVIHRITENEAFQLYDTQWWRDKSPVFIAQFQLQLERLCCPFTVYHDSLAQALGRPVYIHELVDPWSLWDELHEKKAPPTLQEIIDMGDRQLDHE